LDPFSAFSNGKTDETGKPLSDYAYAMKLLNLRPEKIYGMGGALVKSSLSSTQRPSGWHRPHRRVLHVLQRHLYEPSQFRSRHPLPDQDRSRNRFPLGPRLVADLSNLWFTVRWTGQVKPQFSETYIFETVSTRCEALGQRPIAH